MCRCPLAPEEEASRALPRGRSLFCTGCATRNPPLCSHAHHTLSVMPTRKVKGDGAYERSFQYLSTWAAEQRERRGSCEKMWSITSGGSHRPSEGTCGAAGEKEAIAWKGQVQSRGGVQVCARGKLGRADPTKLEPPCLDEREKEGRRHQAEGRQVLAETVRTSCQMELPRSV